MRLTISATEMRSHFDEYIRRIKSGDVNVITKYGKPIGQFIPTNLPKEEQKPSLPVKRKRDISANRE